MYAQLNTTLFDGLKSFVSFSSDEEAVLVEHALINRKPRLQGAGLGLRTLSITIFLHQSFCKVKQEISNLRTSKDTYEVLPLLWGTGEIEGNFVITTMSIQYTNMDEMGNVIAASVSLALKEFIKENEVDTAQQQAKQNAFATGDKKPATKSIRVNPTSCNQYVARLVSSMQNNNAQVQAYLRSRSNTNMDAKAKVQLKTIKDNAAALLQSTTNSDYPCMAGKNQDVTTAWDKINKACDAITNQMGIDASAGSLNKIAMDYNAVNLQAGVNQMIQITLSNVQFAALRK